MDFIMNIINSEMFQTIQLVVVIAGGVLCIIAMILKMFPGFVKKHIISEFNGPDCCADCNRTTCDQCELWKEFNNG